MPTRKNSFASNSDCQTIKNNLFSSGNTVFSNIRIMQKNIVYVIGLSGNLANKDVLSSYQFFGQYGKILKIVINQSGYTQKYQNDTTYSAYVTYPSKEDASLALLCIDNCVVDNHTIRCSFGTTKYCNFFLKGVECINKECLYLHEWATEEDMISKDDIIGGNKQLFFEQQKIALKIADIFNKEKKEKILSKSKRINDNNGIGFPSVESIYKKEMIFELAKSINKEKGYNSKKRRLNSPFYENVYYGCKTKNVDNLKVENKDSYNNKYNEDIEYVLVKEPNKKKKKLNKNNHKIQSNKKVFINKVNSSRSSKSNDSTIETTSSSSKLNCEIKPFIYQKSSNSRYDFVINNSNNQYEGIIVPNYITDLIEVTLSSFCYSNNFNKKNEMYLHEYDLIINWNNN